MNGINEEQRKAILEFLEWQRASTCTALLIDCDSGTTFPRERFADLVDEFEEGLR